jgi:AcrR family transcriptional regulator
VTRTTRQAAKEATRSRLLEQARRLFRERGYAATSLEQVADAAQVTKGAIYGHFASKEDLLISAMEDEGVPAWASPLSDASLPLRERLTAFSAAMAADETFRDAGVLAMELEFHAAVLRSPAALARYRAILSRLLADMAGADPERPPPGPAPVEAWAIGHALFIGLMIDQKILPDVVTPEVFQRAFGLLAGLYPDS